MINRVIAKMVDIFLVFFVSGLVLYPIGPLLGFAYSLTADGLNIGGLEGQSVGKRIMRLQVVNVHKKTPCTLRESILRNTPVGVATFFAIIPVWGWLILALIGIPLMIMEIYLMLSVDSGHRLGDVMGDTEVIEYKKA
ncbi:MAG: RDD family protein [Bdellovibrionota bacterium]